MISPNEHICPICGRILDSTVAYRRHYVTTHEPRPENLAPNYPNGCPILDDGTKVPVV